MCVCVRTHVCLLPNLFVECVHLLSISPAFILICDMGLLYLSTFVVDVTGLQFVMKAFVNIYGFSD